MQHLKNVTMNEEDDGLDDLDLAQAMQKRLSSEEVAPPEIGTGADDLSGLGIILT